MLETGKRVVPLLAAAAAAPRSEMASIHDDLFVLRDFVRDCCGGRSQDAALVRILDAAFRALGVKAPVDYKYLKVVLSRKRRREALAAQHEGIK